MSDGLDVSLAAISRVERLWRESLRDASARGDRGAYDTLKSLLSQLHEWRRRASGPFSAQLSSALNESILNLLSVGAPACALTPRTQGDAVADSGNTPVLTLLGLLEAAQRRLHAAARPPTSASRCLADEVAKGLHGGPGVPNERASDACRLSAALHARSAAPTAADVCQLSVDVDVASSLCARGSLRQAAVVFLRVWDARSGEYLSSEAAIDVAQDGRLAAQAPLLAEAGAPGSVAWAQTLFLNIPRAAIVSGRCHVLFRLFRRGGLKEDGGGPAAAASAPGAAASAAHPPPTAASSGISGLFSRLMKASRDDAAEYLRPMAIALLPIPAALTQLSDGTPHTPSAKLHWMRPVKLGEEVRFSTLHIALEREGGSGAGGGSGSGSSSSSSSSSSGSGSSSSSSSSGTSSSSSSSSINDAALGPTASAANSSGVGGSGGSSSSSELDGHAPASAAPSSSSNGSEEGVRHGGLDALPVVLRCYSSMPLPTLLDKRYEGALAPGVRAGACALPFSLARIFGDGEDSRLGAAEDSLSLAGAEAAHFGSEGSTRDGISPRGREAAEARKFPRVALYNTAFSGIDALPVAVEAETGVGRENAPFVPPPFNPKDHLETLAHIVHPNILSVTIRKGTFSQDSKMTPRNVQVRARVVTDQGRTMACLLRPVQASVLHGNGAHPHPPPPEPLLSEWHSAVYYHSSAPNFDASFAVSIPSAGLLSRAHLLLTFWHASSTSAKTHMFSFAYLPLTDSDGVVLRDGTHSLPCFAPVPGLEAASALLPLQPFMPWYLVAPIISVEGAVLQPPAPWHLSGDPAEDPSTRSGSGRLPPHYASQARTRSLPASARPQSLVQILSGAPDEGPSSGLAGSAVGGSAAPVAAAAAYRWAETPAQVAAQRRLALQQMWGMRSFIMLGGAGNAPAGAAAAEAAAAEAEGAHFLPALSLAGASASASGGLLDPLELRPKDTIEIQTRMLSMQRASLKESHTVATWRDRLPASPATLVDALCTLQRLPSCPDLLLRDLSCLLRSLCALLGAFTSGELEQEAVGEEGSLMPVIISEAFSLLATLLTTVGAGGLYPATRLPPSFSGAGSVPAGLRGMQSPALHSSYAGVHALPSFLVSVPLPHTLHLTLFSILQGLSDAVQRCSPSTGHIATLVVPLPPPLPRDITLPIKRLFSVWRVWGTLVRMGCASATLALMEAPAGEREDELHASGREAMIAVLGSSLSVLRLKPVSLSPSPLPPAPQQQQQQLVQDPSSPPWVLLLQVCVLRTLADALGTLREWLTPEEVAFFLHQALTIPCIRHWSLVLSQPTADDAPASIRLSTLVLLRGTIDSGVLDYASGGRGGGAASAQGQLALATAAARVLAAQLNESDLQRGFCFRLCGALLERHEARLKRLGSAAGVPQALQQQGRVLYSLLGEISKALKSLLLRRHSAGEAAAERLASLNPPSPAGTLSAPASTLLAAASSSSASGSSLTAFLDDAGADKARHRRRACLPMCLTEASGNASTREQLLAADPLLRWDMDCRGLPNSLALELCDGGSGGGAPAGSMGEGACAWATSPLRAVAAACIVSTAWNALAPGVSPSLEPFPLALELSGGDGTLLNLTASLLSTATLLLSSRIYPPSWTVLHTLVHTSALRVLSFCGDILGGAHRGIAEDDARFLPMYALRCGFGGEERLVPPGGTAAAPATAGSLPFSWLPAQKTWEAFIQLTLALLTSPWMSRDALPGVEVIERRPQVCAIFRAAWGEGRAASASVEAAAGGPCSSLCLTLAPILISPMLDLTHSRSAETATLARDVYIDLIASELRLTLSLPGGATSRGLPEMERLTLDAIDTLVVNSGPTLVPVAAAAPTAAAPSATHRAYRLPPNNLIMSLFASSGRRGSASVTSSGRRGSASVTSGGGSVALVDASGVPAAGPLPPSPSSAILTHDTVKRFLREIRNLYSMLSSLANYPRTPEYEYERTRAARRLIAYLRSTHRYDMYARYVTYLTDLHKRLGNAPEAALSFLLHADVLSWRPAGAAGLALPPIMPTVRDGEGKLVFPQHSPSARLESVLQRALSELKAAECWEEAIRITELLALRYEHGSAEYGKLAGVLRAKAALCEAIARDERMFPSYFVVRYNSSGTFPRALRSKTCIVRGKQGEWIADFEERMLKKWAGAAKRALSLDGVGKRAGREGLGAGGGAALQSSSAVGLEVRTEEEEEEGKEEEEDEEEEEEAGGVDMEGLEGAVGVADYQGSSSAPSSRTVHHAHSNTTRRPPALSFAAVRVCDGVPRDVVGTALASILHLVGMRVAPSTLASATSPSSTSSALRRGSSPPTSAAALPSAAALGLSPFRSRQPPSLAEALHDPAPLWLSGGYASALSALPPPAPLHRACPPEYFALHESPGEKEVPTLLRTGREQGGARVFMHQRPFRVRSARSDNEILDAWVERSYLVTAEAFPSTLRTSRVVRVHKLRLNPIEMAVLELSKKTAMLMEQAEAAAAGPDRAAPQAFSQTLSGCVDAAVSGGVANYAPLFTDAYRSTYPEIAADLEAESPPGSGLRPKEGLVALALLPALDAHTRALRLCTAIHADKCSGDMLPLHAFLEGRLKRLLDKVAEWGIGSNST